MFSNVNVVGFVEVCLHKLDSENVKKYYANIKSLITVLMEIYS